MRAAGVDAMSDLMCEFGHGGLRSAGTEYAGSACGRDSTRLAHLVVEDLAVLDVAQGTLSPGLKNTFFPASSADRVFTMVSWHQLDSAGK